MENQGGFNMGGAHVPWAEPLYFGCKGDAGHYAWDAHGTRLSSKNPDAHFLMMHDGQLAPKKDYTQGKAILHHYPEYAILAYWDNKVDSRPGSNTMFLIPGKTNPAQAIETIKQHFPQIWQRSPATVVGEMNHG